MSGQFERACCLALLTQNLDQALEILDSASKADTRYGYLWIALKYSNEQTKQTSSNKSTESLASKPINKPEPQHISSLSPSAVRSTSSLSTQNSHNSLGNYTNSNNNNKSPYFSLNDSFEINAKSNTNSNNSSSNVEPDSSFINIKEYNKLIESFNDPYLKALFNYLINKEEAIMKILVGKLLFFSFDNIFFRNYLFEPLKKVPIRLK